MKQTTPTQPAFTLLP
jgi:serine/threonine protein kinase